MKNFELNNYGVQEMNTMEMKEVDGGMALAAFNWDMFWSGCKVGLGVGGAVGTIYYFA